MFISKTSSRRLQDFWKTCLQYAFKTCLQDMSSRHVFKTSSRRHQCNNLSSSKASSRSYARYLPDVFKTYLQDVFKTSSRSYGRRNIVTLNTCWRHLRACLEDVFQMFAGMVDISIITSLWPWRFMTSHLNFDDFVSICYCTQLKTPMSTKKTAYY